jgi:hypothetical protein
MKRLLILGLTLALLAPATQARKKQGKAGKITDNVFLDSKYGFSITVHENWKAKPGKAKKNVRLRLTQRKYGIPSDYTRSPDYTKIPMLVVYVDTTSLGVHAFIDSLTNVDYRSKQKKAILKEFDFLGEPELIPKRRSRIEIDGNSGLIWKGQAKYTKEIQESASSIGGKRVKSSYGGAIAAVKIGKNIILIHLMTEWGYFDQVMLEVLPMISGMTFEEDES